ncbi:MAG: SDR family oxidoreductase [Alphaproteobacteria bacterium]|nr:SDR family oxidoreductase [Alphaproteobacteria bacterium]
MGNSTCGVALVTGAARRIGRTIALRLASEGFVVAVHYHASSGEAADLVAEITSHGGQATAFSADLASTTDVATLVPRVAKALGPLTLLVNNASLFERDTLATLTDASWDAHLTINLRAPVMLAQAFARQLPPGTKGNIVNLIDQKVLNLTPYYTSYTAAKAGLWALTQTLAQELAPRIRVNAIGPGPTLPNQTQSAADFARYAAAMPLGIGPSPEDIAATVSYILAMPALTGHMIPLDGGEHLGWATPRRTDA